jgi:Class-II DAHP synthetase family
MSLVLVWGNQSWRWKLHRFNAKLLRRKQACCQNSSNGRAICKVYHHTRYLPLLLIDRHRPRSNITEIVDGKEIPAFRGDNINGFDPSERTLDPNRLIKYVQGPQCMSIIENI